MSKLILAFEGVSKSFPQAGRGSHEVLHEISFSISRGQVIAMVGRSGSGKSTLLHLAAGIELPSQGTISLGGRDLGRLSESDRTRLRRDTVGLVFQFFHLLPKLSVFDNVALPEWIAGQSSNRIAGRVHDLLDRVGLADRADEPVQKLSGGEMQRVALCRALLRRPPLLLADEPTGNLDDETARTVMDLLLRMVREEGSTLLYVTHSLDMAELADQVWDLHSGVLTRPDDADSPTAEARPHDTSRSETQSTSPSSSEGSYGSARPAPPATRTPSPQRAPARRDAAAPREPRGS